MTVFGGGTFKRGDYVRVRPLEWKLIQSDLCSCEKNKVCLVKAMVFPVVMYGCERWTIKKAVHQRIDAFELWC